MQKRRLLPLACALLLTGWGAASAPSGAVPSAPQSAIQTVTLKDQTYYMIETEEDLRAIGPVYPLSGNYMLNQTIKLQEKWTPIGTAEGPFTGRFIGNGFAVTGFIVEAGEGGDGLFRGMRGRTASKPAAGRGTGATARLFFPCACPPRHRNP